MAPSLALLILLNPQAHVRVTGNRHFSGSNLRAGLPRLSERATPVVSRVDGDIQLSNENPANHLRVTLMAGTQPGEIDAEVQAQDRNPLQFSLGYNNSGTDSTGRHRLSLGIQHANLSDRDDLISAQFQTSPGHFEQVKVVVGLSYRLPVYSRAATVEAFVAHSDVSNGTTQTLAGPLAFAGKGSVLGVRGNLHFDRLGDYDHRMGLGLDWRDYDIVINGPALTISNSPSAILDWQSFSIGVSNSVHFQQQSAASQVLNRVVGQDASRLLGGLSSNGRVWLVNPHGVLFGSGARVDVAGLVAATLLVSNGDFLSGRSIFGGAADRAGAQVLNQGQLIACPGAGRSGAAARRPGGSLPSGLCRCLGRFRWRHYPGRRRLPGEPSAAAQCPFDLSWSRRPAASRRHCPGRQAIPSSGRCRPLSQGSSADAPVRRRDGCRASARWRVPVRSPLKAIFDLNPE